MLSYFFGKGEETKDYVENEDPQKAMQEQLTAHGKFGTNE